LVDLILQDHLGSGCILELTYNCDLGATDDPAADETLSIQINENGAISEVWLNRADAEKLARLIGEKFQIDLTPEPPTPQEPAPEVDAW
jgi:hypothetical protein